MENKKRMIQDLDDKFANVKNGEPFLSMLVNVATFTTAYEGLWGLVFVLLIFATQKCKTPNTD